MPRPPYIRVGAEVAISPRGSAFASSTLRERQSDMRGKVSLPANASPPTQAPTGQPCSTGVGNNPLTITKPSQRAVSRMPQARRSRSSLMDRDACATVPFRSALQRWSVWCTHFAFSLVDLLFSIMLHLGLDFLFAGFRERRCAPAASAGRADDLCPDPAQMDGRS